MKALASLLILTTMSASAVDIDYCKNLQSLAGTVMEMRQDNFAMSDLHDTLGDKRLPMLLSAYEVPLYSTIEYKKKAIVKFKNQAFKACIEQGGS